MKAPLASARLHPYLLRKFVARDIRGRLAGSMGGGLWTVLTPLATILVYMFVFSIVLRVRVTVPETGTDSYALFFLAGLLPWFFFLEGLSRSAGCVIENANLVTKVVFPVELLPAGRVLTVFLTNGIGLFLFMVYLATRGYADPTWSVVPLLLLVQMIFIWGIAAFAAAASVFLRDLTEIIEIFLRLWFFATPIIYPLSRVPETFRPIMALNPMAGFVGLYRDLLLAHQFEWAVLARLSILSLTCYAVGTWFFMRSKGAFGDVL
jgi:lipopolysaccharide transport system permease protein